MKAIISFISQKGGVGKTTSAINLATALAIGDYKILLIDLDPQGSVRFSFGYSEKNELGTKDIFLSPEQEISELIFKTEEHQNLDFIFSNIDKISEEKLINTVSEKYSFLKERLDKECKDYDFIIIDAPASTNNLAINAMYASDLIVLPLQCENLAIKSLKRFLTSFQELQKTVKEKDLRLAGILLTMYDKDLLVHRKICQQLYKALSDVVFETIIPKNESIISASALGKSVISHKVNSVGATAYIRLMNELIEKFGLK